MTLNNFLNDFRLNRKTAAKIADRIARLENVLNSCIERIIDGRTNMQIDAICLLIKACTNQKSSRIHDFLEKKVLKVLLMIESVYSIETNPHH